MEFIIKSLLDFIHIITYVIMCEWLFQLPRRAHKHWFQKFWLVIVLGVVAWNIVDECNEETLFAAYLLAVLYVALVVAIYMIFYTEEKKKLILICIWSIGIVNVFDQIPLVVVKTYCRALAITENKYLENFIIEVIVVFCFLTMGFFIKKRYKNGLKELGVAYYISYAVMAFGNFCMLAYFGGFVVYEVTGNLQRRLVIIFLFIAAGIVLQMVMVIFLALSGNVHKENEKLAAKYLNEQKSYYEYLEERDRNMKKIRHDLANHLYVMQTLALQKENDKLEEYMNVINGEIDSLGNVISVNNGIVDAILNKYLDEAEKLGIKMEVTGKIPFECKVSEFDLCIIFSNLLSNAIEAERQWEGGKIKVSCGYTEKQITICVENHVKEKVEKKNGKLCTTELDKRNHGFGLENVEECVKRNGGEMLIKNVENWFRVMIFWDNKMV